MTLTGLEQPAILQQKTALLAEGGAQSGALAQILALLPGLSDDDLRELQTAVGSLRGVECSDN